MKLKDNIYIVASGDSGFSLTNPYDCTVYLLDGGGECALIDAGAGIEPQLILKNILIAGFSHSQIKYILLTHGHGDHAGGAAALAEACGAKVYAMEPVDRFVSKGDLKALSIEIAIDSGIYEKDYLFTPCPVQPLNANDIIFVGSLSLEVVASEGHSDGHCCFLLKEGEEKILFSGDVIQCGGKIALQPIWDCNLQKYIKTINNLEKLHPDVLLPGHGSVALQRGWIHIEKAKAALDNLILPKNSIGE